MHERTKWRIINSLSLLFSAGILINVSNLDVNNSAILQRLNILTILIVFVAVGCSITNLYRERSKFIATTGFVSSLLGLTVSLIISNLFQFPTSNISEIPWEIFGVIIVIFIPILLIWIINKQGRMKLSTTSKIFVASLSTFLILWILIIPELKSYKTDIKTIAILILYVAEISGLLLLLIKLDHIYINSNLKLWGLRLLSLFLFGIGLILVMYGMISSNISLLSLISTPTPKQLSRFFAISIVGGGLMLIGSYLGFKFMRKAGLIIFAR